MELNNKILEIYFSYLTVIKARSPHTISEFRVDLRLLRLLFKYVLFTSAESHRLSPQPTARSQISSL